MRIKSWHLLFVLAAVILLLGHVYRQATRLPEEYRIDLEKVAYVRIISNQDDSQEITLDSREDMAPLISAYNSGINYRAAARGDAYPMEMVVELLSGGTFSIGNSSPRVFWVSVEREGTLHEFKMNSRSLGREFGFLRKHFNPS